MTLSQFDLSTVARARLTHGRRVTRSLATPRFESGAYNKETPAMTTPPSRRAAQRLAAQIRDEQVSPPTLPHELAAMLDAYRPTGTTAADYNLHIAATHRAVMIRSGAKGAASFRKLLGVAGNYLTYRHDNHLSVTVENAFCTEQIDHYYLHGLTGSDRTRNDYRSRLHKLAARVNPGPGGPLPGISIGHRAVRPGYSDIEMVPIIRAARRQRSARTRRQLCAIVGLGAGAGLDPSDLRPLHVRDIVDLGDNGIDVHVPAHPKRAARVVPVRRTYEALVREGIAGCRPSDLVIGKQVDRRNVTTGIIDDAELFDVGHLDASRLRSTWLAWIVTQPISLKAVMDAAGLKTARSITEIIADLRNTAEQIAGNEFRGDDT